jgi:ribonuclease P protein component
MFDSCGNNPYKRRFVKELAHETYLSTQQTRPQAPSWFSRPYGNQRWTPRIGSSPRPRAEASFGLNVPEGFVLSVLRRRSEFLAVAAHGKKWVTPAFVVQIAPAPEIDMTTIEYGLTASRKVGNAVKRNRARRRLRAMTSALLPETGKPDVRYIIIAREAALTRDYEAMKKDFLWALKKLEATRDPTP